MDAVRDRLVLEDLTGILQSLEAALAAARDEVDALNVFPVPDGDTGTNLLLTVRSALDALEDAGDTPPCQAAGRGAVLGARGNSGVIFSQVIRALCERLADHDVTAADAGPVLRRARDLAYEAVADPVGGTILSAMDAAADVLEHDGSLLAVLDAAVEATADAVAATRDQLEENRAAGVVDAGARGFEVALSAVRAFVAGQDPPARHPPPIRRVAEGDVVHRESGSLDYDFEVQYLLEADDEVAPTLRRALDTIGDSVVVVACGGLLNVHVHTNDIGAAVEAGAEHGHVFRVQVTSFADQIAHLEVQPGAAAAAAATRPPHGFGVVAVLPGQRLADLARQDGAVVVDGAAGRLPTVADLVDAARHVHAERVAILPGHRNAVPTALKAAELAAEDDLDVEVVAEAVSVPAVLAALAMIDPDEGTAEDLREPAGSVRAGEVVAAVRDADTPVGPVTQGQWLVVVGNDVVAFHDDPVDALADLVRRLCVDAVEVITVIVGEGVGAGESHRAASAVDEACGSAEVDLIDGGQRPVRYVVGVE